MYVARQPVHSNRPHSLLCLATQPIMPSNPTLGPQLRQKPRPTALVFVYLSPSSHVFNIAWQAMIKTYNMGMMTHTYVYVLIITHFWCDFFRCSFHRLTSHRVRNIWVWFAIIGLEYSMIVINLPRFLWILKPNGAHLRQWHGSSYAQIIICSYLTHVLCKPPPPRCYVHSSLARTNRKCLKIQLSQYSQAQKL